MSLKLETKQALNVWMRNILDKSEKRKGNKREDKDERIKKWWKGKKKKNQGKTGLGLGNL